MNELYLNQTPLGAALTCGNNNFGDARIVRMLLGAKADPMKETKMCHSPFFHAPMTNHNDLAKKYSNKRCQLILEAHESQRMIDISVTGKKVNL